MPSLFDYLKSINETKEYMLDSEENIKQYTPFIINRGIAQTQDGIFLAQEMNKMPFLSKEMNYAFYYHLVTKKKRYAKWPKKLELNNNVETIMSYYQVSLEKALEYNKLLTNEQVEILKDKMRFGGKKKN